MCVCVFLRVRACARARVCHRGRWWGGVVEVAVRACVSARARGAGRVSEVANCDLSRDGYGRGTGQGPTGSEGGGWEGGFRNASW